jgi:hypothetical protein
MLGGVETSCHTRLPSLNYAGSNVQPSVDIHSLTHSNHIRQPNSSVLQNNRQIYAAHFLHAQHPDSNLLIAMPVLPVIYYSNAAAQKCITWPF